VGRRFFLLFITCALVPIILLALLSYNRVTEELERQSKTRLFQGAKSAGVLVFERLNFLNGEIKEFFFDVTKTNLPLNQFSTLPPKETFNADFFRAVAIMTANGNCIPLLGTMQEVPSLTSSEASHVNSGKTLLSTLHAPGQPPRILMRKRLPGSHAEPAIFTAEINESYILRGVAETACPPMAEMCVLDHSGKMLFSSQSDFDSLPANNLSGMVHSPAGGFDWKHEDKEYFAVFWSLFTKHEFFTPKWIIVMREPRDEVLAPRNDFRNNFISILILTFLVVLLLSFRQIKRNLIPLQKLQEGTHGIARHDLKTRVSVKSGDEFEELADAFNAMAGRLEKQFDAMGTMNEIDRSVLSALSTEKIVVAVLARLGELFPCDCAGLALFPRSDDSHGEMYINTECSAKNIRMESIQLIPGEMQALEANPEMLVLSLAGKPPAYLASLSEYGMKSFLVLPVIVNNKLSGFMALGYRNPSAQADEDRIHARQIADQIAVALSSARLIEDLEELSWGTLYALARTIDAKSPWTAGHSERVTSLSLQIGTIMKLSQKELDNLHRAGLLHDIGKLGVPVEILDKPSRLTEEEFALMRKHPEFGARILEPITAYRAVLPLVLYHHENYDGSGYPEGLSGERIPMGARIFALADVYDALASDRPYRHAMEEWEVLDYIKSGSGTEFDPKVTEAFLEVIKTQKG
jgi:response regulator RpfG family c-di-GMP phosphodiesterase/HAMP domain-containing protein